VKPTTTVVGFILAQKIRLWEESSEISFEIITPPLGISFGLFYVGAGAISSELYPTAS